MSICDVRPPPCSTHVLPLIWLFRTFSCCCNRVWTGLSPCLYSSYVICHGFASIFSCFFSPPLHGHHIFIITLTQTSTYIILVYHDAQGLLVTINIVCYTFYAKIFLDTCKFMLIGWNWCTVSPLWYLHVTKVDPNPMDWSKVQTLEDNIIHHRSCGQPVFPLKINSWNVQFLEIYLRQPSSQFAQHKRLLNCSQLRSGAFD